MTPLIPADNHLLLWAFVMLAAAAAVYAEQNFRWAAKVPGAVIALMPRSMAKLDGSQELGTYCIFLFFVVIGVPASIPLILQNAPLLFVFTLTVAVVNLAVTLAAGKLFKYSIEEVVLACNANIGGPTTAAALAIGRGWRALVGPILVIGTAGYIFGNYIGSMIYALLSSA